MVFCTPEFLLLFAVCLLGLKLLGRKNSGQAARAQQLWLLSASALFYGFFDSRFLALLALSIVLDYYLAQVIERFPQWRLRTLQLSIVCNLAILGFFKYFDFFSSSAARLLSTVGLGYDPLLLRISLPLGISFYTFQSLGYVVDVYRGKQRASRDLLHFALFLSFFPQLVAGPIERAKDLLPQLVGPFTITSRNLIDGLGLILLGFVKKALVADTLAVLLVDPVFGFHLGSETSSGQVALAALGFTLQVYCDFSGYVDIGRGCARIIGVSLQRNFRAPFFSPNISAFWDRWNITISHWFRDYVFIPLGGSRGGEFQTLRNIAITMILCGFWHGAENKYLIWGAYYAAFQIAHRLLFRSKRVAATNLLWQISGALCTFLVVVVASFLFRSANITKAMKLASVFLRFDSLNGDSFFWALLPLLIVATCIVLLDHLLAIHPREIRWWQWPVSAQLSLGFGAGTVAAGVLLFGSVFKSRAFIYFQF